jgi:hypothetical protein
VGIEKNSGNIEKNGVKHREAPVQNLEWRVPFMSEIKKMSGLLLRRTRHLKVGIKRSSWHNQCFSFIAVL